MTSMQGKVIALTGGASGIGLATAQVLASRGAILALADTNQAGLEAAIKSLDNSDAHTATVVDVMESSQINAWINGTVAKLGKLDGAANIAGVAREGWRKLADSKDEDWEFVMGINGRGVFYCMRAELNNMKDGGSIVNAASVAGLRGLPGTAIYGATKHAVIGLTKVAARENGDRNIRVNCVAPGLIATPMVRAAEAEIGQPMLPTPQCLARQADPSEVAKVVAFLLSDDASFVTGATYTVDAGWTA